MSRKPAIIDAQRLRQAPAWAPVRATTLSWGIVIQIRDALFNDQICGGDFLGTEGSLAQTFEVSRMAMRDALRSLEALGVVEIRPGAQGGVWVAKGNPERFANALAIQLKLIGVSEQEVIEAQMAIEATTAELAAQRATPKDLEWLRALLDESANLLDDPVQFADSAMSFHMAIVEASHNQTLIAQWKALRHILQPAYSKRTTHEIAERVVAVHRELLVNIETGQVDAARQSMCTHLETVRTRGFANTDEKLGEEEL